MLLAFIREFLLEGVAYVTLGLLPLIPLFTGPRILGITSVLLGNSRCSPEDPVLTVTDPKFD